LLKIVLVNLKYRIGMHMNFARSRIPVLVCSLQSEYGCYQPRSYGGQRGNAKKHVSVQNMLENSFSIVLFSLITYSKWIMTVKQL